MNDEPRATLLAFRVTPYTDEQHARLRKALSAGTAQEYCRLNFDLGGWLAGAVVGVLADAGVARNEIRAIGSHGQSLWHEPLHSTWQLGEAAVIAERKPSLGGHCIHAWKRAVIFEQIVD